MAGQSMGLARAWVGDESLRESVRAALDGIEVLTLPQDRPWEAPSGGELVVLRLDGSTAIDAFVLCSMLKAPGAARVLVALVCDEQQREVVDPIARFCLCDTVVTDDMLAEAGAFAAELEALLAPPRARESVDVLLARVEDRIGGHARELADRVANGLSRERERSFVSSVTDSETGLFEGPFMAFKLEEEFKRSFRFRTPLAVLLLDLPRMDQLGEERARVLAEVAGVFLNECRDIDVLGRYDDTSFLLLLPSTGARGAHVLARRILTCIEALDTPEPLEPAVAIVAVPKVGVDRKDELLDLARLTLVAAWSESGSERICVAE